MKVTRTKRPFANRPGNERGFTLIESMLAAAMLLIVMAGIASLFAVMMATNANQGENATRTTEFAQDQMEQLMALPFGDPGLGGSMAANATVGGVTQGSPQTSYYDYLDKNGTSLGTSTTGAFYTRQWMVQTDSTANLKTITVTVWATNIGTQGLAPATTLVSIRANF